MKDMILRLSTYVAFLLFVLGGCGLDGNQPIISAIMTLGGLVYLCIFAYANGEFRRFRK